jgi:transcriptional regulator with XRE-family HTH domain
VSAIAVCECGWRGKRTTPAYAALAAKTHRCERHQVLVEREARVAARKADPGVRRDCHHKVARHEHGTHAAYVLDRCTCRPCRQANAAYEGRRAKEKAYGRWRPYVDAGPARRHLRQLARQGLGPKRVAVLSGVPHGSLAKIVYGDPRRGMKPSKRIRPETEAAIMAVQVSLDTLGSTVAVDATETRLRLRRLIAAGWSQSQLARRLDMQPSNFGRTLNGDQPCRAETARRVRDLYAELRDVAPPESTHRERIASSRARNYARERGWLSIEISQAPAQTIPEPVQVVDVEAHRRREAILKRMHCEQCGRDGTARSEPCIADGRRMSHHDFLLLPMAAVS